MLQISYMLKAKGPGVWEYWVFSFTDLYLAPLSELLFHLEGKSTLLNESYFIVTEAYQQKTKLKMINASIEWCLHAYAFWDIFQADQ